jgi:hypothetical protein
MAWWCMWWVEQPYWCHWWWWSNKSLQQYGLYAHVHTHHCWILMKWEFH